MLQTQTVPPDFSQNNKRDDGVKKRFLTSAIFAIFGLFLFVYFVPNMPIKTKKANAEKAFAYLSDFNATEFSDIAELVDHSPMFLPTKWNYSASEQILPLPEGWDLKPNRQANYGDLLLHSNFLKSNEKDLAEGRTGLFNSVMRSVFSGFGRKEIPERAQKMGGTFKLIDMQTGKTVQASILDEALTENMSSIVQFQVRIDEDGWIGSPLITSTSGDEKLDLKLSNYLNRSHYLKGINAGTYKAVFTP